MKYRPGADRDSADPCRPCIQLQTSTRIAETPVVTPHSTILPATRLCDGIALQQELLFYVRRSPWQRIARILPWNPSRQAHRPAEQAT
jgi:hypothetical protein